MLFALASSPPTIAHVVTTPERATLPPSRNQHRTRLPPCQQRAAHEWRSRGAGAGRRSRAPAWPLEATADARWRAVAAPRRTHCITDCATPLRGRAGCRRRYVERGVAGSGYRNTPASRLVRGHGLQPGRVASACAGRPGIATQPDPGAISLRWMPRIRAPCWKKPIAPSPDAPPVATAACAAFPRWSRMRLGRMCHCRPIAACAACSPAWICRAWGASAPRRWRWISTRRPIWPPRSSAAGSMRSETP